jgi:hypothetical protein
VADLGFVTRSSYRQAGDLRGAGGAWREQCKPDRVSFRHYCGLHFPPDRKCLYYPTGGAAPKAVPIRLADRRVGRNTDLKDLRRVLGPVFSETHISCAPDGFPVFTRNSAHRKSMRSPSGGGELLSRYLNSPGPLTSSDNA